MGATSAANIAAKPLHPPTGELGRSTNLTAGESITAAIKKIPVDIAAADYDVPSGFNCRAISYNDDAAGKAIAIKCINDDSSDVVELAPRILHPINAATIVKVGTTAATIFIWG